MRLRDGSSLQSSFYDGTIPEPLRRRYQREQARSDPDVLLRGVAALVGTEFQRGLPDGRLHVIGRAKHGMPVSQAAACAALLRDFLAEKA